MCLFLLFSVDTDSTNCYSYGNAVDINLQLAIYAHQNKFNYAIFASPVSCSSCGINQHYAMFLILTKGLTAKPQQGRKQPCKDAGKIRFNWLEFGK